MAATLLHIPSHNGASAEEKDANQFSHRRTLTPRGTKSVSGAPAGMPAVAVSLCAGVCTLLSCLALTVALPSLPSHSHSGARPRCPPLRSIPIAPGPGAHWRCPYSLCFLTAGPSMGTAIVRLPTLAARYRTSTLRIRCQNGRSAAGSRDTASGRIARQRRTRSPRCFLQTLPTVPALCWKNYAVAASRVQEAAFILSADALYFHPRFPTYLPLPTHPRRRWSLPLALPMHLQHIHRISSLRGRVRSQ
jgi:hypothetical protein